MGVIITGISSGSGKTTLSIGLMRAFTNKGYHVVAFKSGPDYIDPMFHRLAVRGNSYNLPMWMLEDDVIDDLYQKRSENTDISVVEGVMGYFDGHDVTSIHGSTAHLAQTIHTPVIAVLDASSMSLTAAAMIQGLVLFDQPTMIKGVIFNHIKSEYHYQLLKNAVQLHTHVKCYGYLKPNDDIVLESRHLGLVQANEVDYIEEKIEKMAKWVTDTVDVEAIFDDFNNAKMSVPLKRNSFDPHLILGKQTLRIGIAKDDAFSFYYDENISLIEEIGMTWVPFSPIIDEVLPESLDGLYIGGGYPELYADALEANVSMRASILDFATDGKPIYAECGGLMYLMSKLVLKDGKSYDMAGVFHGRAIMTDSLQRFGYVEAELDCTKWAKSDKLSSVRVPRKIKYRGHEFHHSKVEGCEAEQLIAIHKNERHWTCGYSVHRVLATYVHNHFYSNLDFVKFLISFYRG